MGMRMETEEDDDRSEGRGCRIGIEMENDDWYGG